MGRRTRDPEGLYSGVEGLYSGVEIYSGVEVERVEAVSLDLLLFNTDAQITVSILPALPTVALLS